MSRYAKYLAATAATAIYRAIEFQSEIDDGFANRILEDAIIFEGRMAWAVYNGGGTTSRQMVESIKAAAAVTLLDSALSGNNVEWNIWKGRTSEIEEQYKYQQILDVP